MHTSECQITYRTAENFGRGKLRRFARNSPNCQLFVISEKAIEAGLKSTKVFLAKCNFACNSPKFFPAQVFCYTVFFQNWQKKLLSLHNMSVTPVAFHCQSSTFWQYDGPRAVCIHAVFVFSCFCTNCIILWMLVPPQSIIHVKLVQACTMYRLIATCSSLLTVTIPWLQQPCYNLQPCWQVCDNHLTTLWTRLSQPSTSMSFLYGSAYSSRLSIKGKKFRPRISFHSNSSIYLLKNIMQCDHTYKNKSNQVIEQKVHSLTKGSYVHSLTKGSYVT